MPLVELTKSVVKAPSYCIVAKVSNSAVDVTTQVKRPVHVKHIALLSGLTLKNKVAVMSLRSHLVSNDKPVKCDHIRVNFATSCALICVDDPMQADLLAYWNDGDTLIDLKHQRAISKYIRDILRSPSKKIGYHIHTEREYANNTPVRTLNCVKLVLNCYACTGIELIDKKAALPLVSEDIIKKIYPDIFSINDIDLTSVGLAPNTDGGWRVMLPGYLINAILQKKREFVPMDINDAMISICHSS